MRYTECVPEDDVGVFDRRVGGGGDPGGETLRGVAAGLGDVAAGGVDFGVGVWWELERVLGGWRLVRGGGDRRKKGEGWLGKGTYI